MLSRLSYRVIGGTKLGIRSLSYGSSPKFGNKRFKTSFDQLKNKALDKESLVKQFNAAEGLVKDSVQVGVDKSLDTSLDVLVRTLNHSIKKLDGLESASYSVSGTINLGLVSLSVEIKESQNKLVDKACWKN